MSPTINYSALNPKRKQVFRQMYNVFIQDRLEFIEKHAHSTIWQVLSENRHVRFPHILHYKNKCWWWEGISYHNGVSLEDILAHPEFPWDTQNVCYNPHVTMKEVLAHPKFPWRYDELVCNKSIKLEDILTHPDLPWGNWADSLTRYGNFTFDNIEYVLQNKHMDWNWNGISNWKNITYEHVANNLDIPWNGGLLSKNPNFGMREVLLLPSIRWHFHELSSNPSITMEDVKNNPQFPWCYVHLSENPNVRIKHVLETPNARWNFTFLSRNKGICIFDIFKTIHLPWDWKIVSTRHDVTLDIVMQYPQCPWDFGYLSFAIPVSAILNHPEFQWNFHAASSNRSLRFRDVADNPHKGWDWTSLILNDSFLFHEDDQDWIDCVVNYMRKVHAVRTIQRAFFRAITNPAYVLCRKRVYSEFQELSVLH
jgi:hypothetical protein